MIRDARYIDGGILETARMKVRDFVGKYLDHDSGVDRPEGDVIVKVCQKAKTGELEIGELPFAVGESIPELVDGILEIAQNEALQWPGQTRFAVRIDGVASAGTFVLKTPRIEEDDDEDGQFEIDELPNKRGIMGQQMRHTEAMTKLALGAATRSQDRDERRIRELEAQNNHLTAKLFDANKIIEEARNLAWMRDMEVRKFESEQARKDQVAQGLLMMGKMIGTTYMQKQGMLPTGGGEGGGPTPFESLGADLFTSLEKDPDRLQQLIARVSDVLSPVEAGALLRMREIILQQVIQAQQAADAAGAPGEGEPEGDPNEPPPNDGPPSGTMNGHGPGPNAPNAGPNATMTPYRPWSPVQ